MDLDIHPGEGDVGARAEASTPQRRHDVGLTVVADLERDLRVHSILSNLSMLADALKLLDVDRRDTLYGLGSFVNGCLGGFLPWYRLVRRVAMAGHEKAPSSWRGLFEHHHRGAAVNHGDDAV
jgi:hypothetical protein